MRRKLAWLAAIACVAWLVPAWALSLGGIRVHSRLNQPLSASIPIYPAAGEVVDETLKVRLASNEDYARAGLERLDFLSDLVFTVEPDRVVISSKRSVHEPVVDLLIDVSWSGGRLLRQYTMLLDPEGVGPAPAPLEPSRAAAATQALPETGGQAVRNAAPSSSGNYGGTRGPRASAPAETPPLTYHPAPIANGTVAPSSAATPSAAPKSLPHTYGPVRPNETPWSVASKLKPDDSITTEQVIIALFQWNPTAFGSNLSTFKPGVTLRVPDAEVMRRVDPAIAKSRIEEARAKAGSADAAAPKPSAAGAAAVAAAGDTVPAASAPKTETAAPKSEAPAPAETAPAPSATTSAAPNETAPSAAPAAEQPAATPPAESAASAETPPPVTAPAPEPEPKKESMGWLIPAVVAAAILFIGILVWRLARRPKSPGEDFAMDEGATLAATPSPRPGAGGLRATVVEEPEPMREPEPAPAAAEPEIPETPPRYTTPEPAPAAAQAAPAPAAPAGRPAGMPSFADTALTDTRQIDLEGGDALAEADFHLAYGLYDEAILLLTQALTRDANRTDVRTKLAEAYFSANRGQEFLDTAKTLKGQLDVAGWEKIAVLGRQLFPSDPLFGGSGKAPAAPVGEAAAPRPAAPAPAGNTLAFDMPAAKPAAPTPPPAAKPAEAASIPFEMGSLDLDTPLEAAPAQGDAAAHGLDLEGGLSADDMGGGDEASTKLDLARAYIDLGDNDMARGLLSEVIQQGTSEQKATAEELMRKLPA